MVKQDKSFARALNQAKEEFKSQLDQNVEEQEKLFQSRLEAAIKNQNALIEERANLAAQKSQDKAIDFTQTLFDQAKERNDELQSKFDTLSSQPTPLSIETVD